jgi:predicted metal-binding protein
MIIGAGATECGEAQTADIEFLQEMRNYCEGNACRQYDTNWACPPAAGTLEECRNRALGYERFALFSQKFGLEDSFDFDGIGEALKAFKETAKRVGAAARLSLKRFQVLSNEGCGRCRECTYPDAPCRFPDELFHSIEGYGINVSSVAKQVGVSYNNGKGTVTFFGALLYSPSDFA